MEFKILGPLEVYDSSGNALRIPTGHERALLVVLLLRAGEVVSTDALIDALWGETPPSTAAKAVQGYVSHLRRQIDSKSGETEGVLATQSPGYVLRVGETDVDALRFERLAASGRRALDDGAPTEALATLDSALELWRGAPIPEFAFDDFAQRDINRLTELQLAVREDRFDALLELGRHGGLVFELEAEVDAHPHRERLRGQLMLALYRTGRQADALQIYKEGSRLSRELGLDPTSELRTLERAILDQDPSIAAPTPVPLPTDFDTAVPKADRPEAAPRRRLRLAAGLGVALVSLAVIGVIALNLVDNSTDPVVVVPPAVAVVDPETNRVVASIPVGSKPVTIAAGNGAVWVGDTRDGTVTRIDQATREVVTTIGIGAPPVDLAVGAGGVWVATGSFGSVLRIDPELDTVAGRFELGAPGDPITPPATSIAVGEGRVWVGAFNGLARIDPRSGEILNRVDLGGNPAFQIASSGSAVWATIVGSRARRVEARSAEVTAEFYAGTFIYPIEIGFAGVWLGGGNGQLWKLDLVTGSTRLTANVGSGSVAIGLAVGSGSVWATVPDRAALVRVDPESGDVGASIPIGGPAEEVVVANGLVWVAVPKPDR